MIRLGVGGAGAARADGWIDVPIGDEDVAVTIEVEGHYPDDAEKAARKSIGKGGGTGTAAPTA